MKKLFSLLLALMLVLSLSTVAFAAEGDPDTGNSEGTTPTYTDMQTITITKDYNLTNEETISPAETFNFTIERTSVTDAAEGVTATNMPIPTIENVIYTEGEAGSTTKSKQITVTLPTYTSVGIYTYTIKEVAGTTAGVTYFDQDIKLVVTVINDGTGVLRVAAVHTEATGEAKTNNFPNVYSAGNLSITKTVTGNMGDKTKYFKVTVNLTGVEGKTYADSYAVTGGTKIENGTTDCLASTITVGTAKDFYLKDGETIIIANLPYDVTYTVEEADYTSDGYDVAAYDFSDDAKKIDSVTDTVGITNNKGVEVDTGINLDSLPYILLLGFVGAALIVVLMKKRTAREN